MSTKTSFKRIALVAVAALGMGVLTSVSPASATVADAVIGDVSDSVNIGASASSTFSFSTTADGETATLTMSVPSGSAITLTDNNGAVANTDDVVLGTDGTGNTAQDDTVFAPTTGVITDTTTADNAAGTITIVPDVAGTYVFTLTAGATTDTYTVYASDLYATTADGLTSGTQKNLAVNGVAGANNYVTLKAIAGTTLTTDDRLLKVTGSTIYGVTTVAEWSVATDKASAILLGGTTDDTLRIATPSVGTITVDLFKQSQSGVFSSTAVSTVTITVGAAATNGAVNAATSTGTLSTTGETVSGKSSVSTDVLTLTAPATSANKVGQVAVVLDPVAGSIPATNVTTAVITGPGYLVISGATLNSTGRSLVEVGTAASFTVSIYGDGTSGKSTVTISSGTWTVTRNVTFYGNAAKLVATQNLMIASTSVAELGAKTLLGNAVQVAVTDKDGNAVSGVTPVAVPATTTVIGSGSCSASDAKGLSFCTVTSSANTAGKTSAVTFKTTVSGVDVVSNAVTFTLGGALAKYSIAFDKTTYTPGAKMILKITGVDALGKSTFDGTKDVFDTAITTSASVTNDWTDDLTGVDFVNGVGELVIYAPLSAGPFSITAGVATGLVTAVGASSLTATTSITESTAVTSLTILINSLIKKINALSTLVAKIQKKLGVK
jgi:hypothetical protein